MNESEAKNLIERGLSAGRPREMFTAQLLADSTAALVQSRRRRARWRMAGLAAAAVLIASISFLGGRLSAPPAPTRHVEVVARGAAESDGVTVPGEVVAWLEAANLFRQLGMGDRVARAVERAGRLLPADTFIAEGQTLRVFAAAGSIENQAEREQPRGIPGPHPSAESMSQILAQSFWRSKNEN